MALEVRTELPGLAPEAKRALVEVQHAVRREVERLDRRASRPKRKVTQLNEQNVIARPGEVVRVKPGAEDITVYLPEPDPANAGEDIVVNVEGDGTQTGRVRVEPMNGTCDAPGIATLNSPGSYRYTSTGAASEGASGEGGGAWSGPPPIAFEDIPAGAAGDGLQGGGGVPLAVDVSDFAGTGLEDDGSENLRIAASAAGAGLTGGGGSALAVGAGTGIAVNANDVQLATIVNLTALANKSGSTTAPTPTALATLLQSLTADIIISTTGEVRANGPAGVALEACATQSASIGANDLCINADSGVSINAGAQQTSVTAGNVEVRATADALINGVGGTALESCATPSVAIATGDVCINADGGIGIRAGVTPITSVTNGAIDVEASGNANLLLGADLIVNARSGVNINADATATVSAVGTGVIALNAPTNGIALTAGLAEENLAGAGDIKLNASSGVRVHAGATAQTTATGVEVSSDTLVRISTNGTERLEIESDGAWQLGGDTGTEGEALISQGASAPPIFGLPTGALIAVTTYDSGSGTHTFDARCNSYVVYMRGGQGGGGGANSAAAQLAVGAGGGEGGEAWLYVTTVPASEAYAVGAGGTAGANTGGDGGDGGTTSWGTTDTATVTGGLGGAGSAATTGSGSGTALGITGPGGNGGRGLPLPDMPTGATVIDGRHGDAGQIGVRQSGTVGWGGAPGRGACQTNPLATSPGQGGRSSNNSDTPGQAGSAGRVTVWEFA